MPERLLADNHDHRLLWCELHRTMSTYLRLDQLCIGQISGTCSEASFFFQACSDPELIQLMLNAQADCPSAERAVKGVCDVQHHLQAATVSSPQYLKHDERQFS